ncbi:low-specificity L-threonine aldolase [Clostridium faecium]|uniref:Low-specificity L-threonine aldolase n=1 Tax=Clostridium faecium TaxID=2762223 RepID=A0ABR8YS24_9CLOT|nr:low-specificity L-threonine aldolase [Clostridium faecium]MBD8046823.1 low-specificity L-threonine aldolase [Clostridium faecium]
MKFIDLRSDTVTDPTDNMRKAMFEAVVGDDVYEDDPTVKELEQYAANLVNKEDALFVPSGTFGNQLAIFTHCNRGEEVILGDTCHIVAHEVGAASVIAGVQLRTIDNPKGILNVHEVEKRIRKDNDIHIPDTSLICVENAHSTGVVVPLDNMRDIYNLAKKYNLKVHLDGARLFNAAAYLNVAPSEITKYTDSVMFCLSKGLCAPVGSILAGSKEFIHQARKKRKLLGGGLRQSGFLAAAGLVALKEMIEPLKIDHENALLLADELEKIPGIVVNKNDIHINMVFFNLKDTGVDGDYIVDKLYEKGIKINGEEDGLMRFVTHHWITKEDIYYVCDILKDIVTPKN